MSRVGYYGGLINPSTRKSCGGSNPPNGTINFSIKYDIALIIFDF